MDNTRLWIYRAGDPLPGKRYVLYWMQQAQRTRCNLALDWACRAAHTCNLPLLVAFALTDAYPGANARHYAFMLEGLSDVQSALQERGIAFTLRHGNPPDIIARLAQDAALLVGDIGYLRIQRAWREQLAQKIDCPFTAIETDAVVPIKRASDKEEFAARTIRPKIHKWLPHFLLPPPASIPSPPPLKQPPASDSAPENALAICKLDRTVPPSSHFQGGQDQAQHRLQTFLRAALPHYHEKRNDPSLGLCSHMSPYLHFGQIAPLDIALQVRNAAAPTEAIDAYLEELIVRRELSMNFVYFNTGYDRYEAAIPDWARKTLAGHAGDKRPIRYSPAQLEEGKTDDLYWNAAQREMVLTGKMHNYMRMYWGKKLIEWSPSPEEAFDWLVTRNDRYEIDGRDPNGYTGVAWCFGKHDRPWTQRPIFGTVRYMAASGLKRKFDIDRYVQQVRDLEAYQSLY